MNTFWGRYLIFALLILPFSLTVTHEENSDFANAKIAFLFNYFGSQVFFWFLYVMVSLQFMVVKKSQFSFSGYMNLVIFMFWLVGISLIVLNIFNSIRAQSLHLLSHVSFGLAFAFAAYNLQLEKKRKSQGL
ncbi:MAG: hypothetical protein AB8B56_00780 [Crocinitomicaceae bacterium]